MPQPTVIPAIDAPSEATAPIVLTLKLPPNRANGRGQSRYESYVKQRLWSRYDAAVTRGEVPPAPLQPFACVALRYDLTTGRPMDWDNAMARMKHAQDWLVRAGYLVDDTSKVVVECPTITQRVNRKVPPTVVVTITPKTHPAAAPKASRAKARSNTTPRTTRRTSRQSTGS